MRCVLSHSVVVMAGLWAGVAYGVERGSSSPCIGLTKLERPDPRSDEYEATGVARCSTPLRLSMALRSRSGQAWWILSGAVDVPRGARWRLSGLRPSPAADPERGFVIRAIGLRPSDPPRTGWVTSKALKDLAVAASLAITIPPSRSAMARDLEAKTLINGLNQRPALSDDSVEYDVGLQATVQGRALRPAGAHAQCVVQPLGSDDRWVMHSAAETDDRFFCLAQFGRSAELDLFERFILYSIISRPRLSPDHGRYTDEEWDALIANGRILAISQPIRTRRTISLQPGQDGAAVSIVRVNFEEIIGTGAIHARQMSFLEGTVDGTSLASHHVAVYARVDAPGSRWRRLGTALSNDGRRWQLLPVYLGEPDQRITLVAVRYHGQAPDLNREDDARYIVAQSAMVRVLVTELPIELTHVGGKSVAVNSGTRAEAPITVERILRIEGSKLDQQPANIALYGRRASEGGGWSLLASLPDRGGSRWATGDFPLPAAGEYVLTAAIGMSQAPANALPSGAGVRLSPPVFIKVER